jgi:hypothetical protein
MLVLKKTKLLLDAKRAPGIKDAASEKSNSS